MMEQPERVWRALPWNSDHAKHGLASWPMEEQAGEGSTEYVRADKVQALVDASRELLRLMDDTVEYHDGPGPEYGEEDPWDMGEWFSDVDRHVIDVTRAALAAFTDGGTQG